MKKVLLGITTFAKLGFGIFFLAGSVLSSSWQHVEALLDFCKSIGRTTVDDKWNCANDIVGGLFCTGSIFLLISIVMEAFGPIKRNLYRTFFHIIGGIFIMLASINGIFWKYEKYVEFVIDSHPYFIPGCWITGGLVSALCQAHIIYCCRSRGCLTIFTLLLSMLGSTLFMIAGILSRVGVGNEVGTGVVFILACVLYILHSLLYPFAFSKKDQDQDDSGATDVFQQFPIQPLSGLEEDNDIASV